MDRNLNGSSAAQGHAIPAVIMNHQATCRNSSVMSVVCTYSLVTTTTVELFSITELSTIPLAAVKYRFCGNNHRARIRGSIHTLTHLSTVPCVAIWRVQNSHVLEFRKQWSRYSWSTERCARVYTSLLWSVQVTEYWFLNWRALRVLLFCC